MTDSQKYDVVIKFRYEAPVFDGDPEDLADLALLEQTEISRIVENALFSYVDFENDGQLEVTVTPTY